MLLPIQSYLLDNDHKDYAVVCEATTRAECEDSVRAYRVDECDVLKESGKEIYRGICKVTTVVSDEKNLKGQY